MTLVQYATGTPNKTRRSDTGRLQAAFPASPALDGYDDDTVSKSHDLLHNGHVVGNSDYAVSATGPGASLDYDGINASTKPAIAGDVATGGGGQPWTAYAPNIVSPGPGSTNPNDIADPPSGSPRASGAGSTKLPGITSPQTSDQQKSGNGPGNLILGQSHPDSKSP